MTDCGFPRNLTAWWTPPLLAASLMLAFALAGGCGGSRSATPIPEIDIPRDAPIAPNDPWSPRSTEGYVGSLVCRECHEEISERYAATHPMANALAPIESATPVAAPSPLASFQPIAGLRYDVLRDGDQMTHREVALTSGEKEIYSQQFDIDYVLGSGTRGRSYLIERNGRFFSSPVSWYSKRATWGLSPGYAAKKHERFDRQLDERCINCHSGRPSYEDWPSRGVFYADPPFAEHGIGCERCHGPAREHVRRHRGAAGESSGETVRGTDDDDPIVNPLKLPLAERDAVCNQCHLSGEFTFLRPGRGDHDFRPGDRLTDIWLIYSRNVEGVDEAVHHPEQMYASRCYTGSQGALGCVSCHDPHERPAPDQIGQFYRRKCLSCHGEEDCGESLPRQQAEPAAGSCVHCHMPKRAASDIPHTSQTDHRVLARPAEQPAQVGPPKSAEEFQLPHLERDDLPAAVRDRGEGLKLVQLAISGGGRMPNRRRLAEQAVTKLKEVVATGPGDDVAWTNLGRAYVVLDEPEKAADAWRRAAWVNPLAVEPRRSLLVAARKRKRLDEALRLAGELAKLEPWNANWAFERATLLVSTGGSVAEAAQHAVRAVELNPSEIKHYELAAKLLRETGENKLADEYEKRWRQLAISLSRRAISGADSD